MKVILKMLWHEKVVCVEAVRPYVVREFGKALHIIIKVADTTQLTSEFARGVTYKTNPDIINSVGGMPTYVTRMLNAAAHKESQRRTRPIQKQLRLF